MSLAIALSCVSLLVTPSPLRASVVRPRAPHALAFEDGVPFENEGLLSEDELRAVLSGRGIKTDDMDKGELESLLHNPLTDRFGRKEAERISVFERTAPSVAFIHTVASSPSRFALQGGEYPTGAGSGFVWDAEGHIITNHHVISGGGMPRGRSREMPRKVMVTLPGCEEAVEAQVVGFEADKDLAVLKVDPTAVSLKPLEIGSSSDLRVGQDVLAIGNPFSLDGTLTRGIVSALGRDIHGAGGRPIKDCVQTDAAINPGNSGGPLLDSQGKLIGMNTMIYSPGGLGANVGIGFAIPVDTIRRIVNQILTFGPNARPSLGVSILPDQLRTQYSRGLKRKLEGAVITEVVPGSPADELGLEPCKRQLGGILLGDMITAVNGQPVKQNEDLLCAVEESEPANGPITLTVMRGCDDSRIEEVEITPVPRKELVAERDP